MDSTFEFSMTFHKMLGGIFSFKRKELMHDKPYDWKFDNTQFLKISTEIFNDNFEVSEQFRLKSVNIIVALF